MTSHFLKPGLWLLLFIFTIITPKVYANDSSVLPRGIWEGLYENHMTYIILEVREDGAHVLHNVYLGDNLSIRQYPFTDNNIEYNRGTWRIKIETPTEDETIELFTSKFSDGMPLEIFQTVYDLQDGAILTKQYILNRKSDRSSLREMMGMFKKSFIELSEEPNRNSDDKIHGLWIGTLNRPEGPELVMMDIKEQGQSRWVRSSLGTASKYEATFEFSEADKLGHALVFNTAHDITDTTLIVHWRKGRPLRGNSFTYIDDTLLYFGRFTLRKFQPPTHWRP